MSATILDEGISYLFLDTLPEFRPIFPSALEVLVGLATLASSLMTFAAAIGMVARRAWPVSIIQPAALLSVIGGMLALMHRLAFGPTLLINVCILAPFAPVGMRLGLGGGPRPARLRRLNPIESADQEQSPRQR